MLSEPQAETASIPLHLRTPSQILEALKAGHDRFLSGHSIHPHANQDHLKELEEGQHPAVAILSCSDSRVPVELLFDSGFGDIFVVRNAGNACTAASAASLEYAVKELHVKLLLVMGHENCGAVTAACGARQGLTPNLLELVGEIRDGLDAHGIGNEVAIACRRHPRITAEALLSNSALLQQSVASSTVELHSACYTLDGGRIEWQGRVQA